MARAPFRGLSGPEAITPQAAPVNTYVRPADPTPSSLHGLAEGLGKFDAGLSTFLDGRRKKQDDADKIRAEAAFNSNNQLGWAEAVRQGKVPANASPIFMQSYKSAQGNLAGIQLRDKFNKAYLSWEGRSSNDPAQFQQFYSDFIKQSAGDVTDVDVLRGLNPHMQQLSQDAYGKFSEDSANSVYSGHLNTSGALASHTIDEANNQSLGQKTGLDTDALFNDLVAQREHWIAGGGRPEDYDKQVVEIIANKSVEHLDPKLLDLLDRKMPGSKFALKDNPAFGEKKQQALAKLEQAAISQESRMAAAQEKADKQRKNELTAKITERLATDPFADIPEEEIKELQKFNPDARKDITEARKTFLSDATKEDPREILLIQREMATGKIGIEDLLKAASEGRISSPSTFAELLDRHKRLSQSSKGGKILEGSAAKLVRKAIDSRLAPRNRRGVVQVDSFGSPVQITDEMLEAQSDFESMLLDWEQRHPDASAMEREQVAQQVGREILANINTQGGRSKEWGRDGDYTSLKERVSLSTSKEDLKRLPDPVAADETRRFISSDQPPALAGTSKEYQDAIAQEAEGLGISKEQFNARVWEELQRQKKPKK